MTLERVLFLLIGLGGYTVGLLNIMSVIIDRRIRKALPWTYDRPKPDRAAQPERVEQKPLSAESEEAIRAGVMKDFGLTPAQADDFLARVREQF